MAFGIYNLFEAFLLIVNAVAVLHEQRFLDKSECFLTVDLAIFIDGDQRIS